MSYTLNAITAPDAYGPENSANTQYNQISTFAVGVELEEIIIDLSNQPIYFNLKKIITQPGGADWVPEEVWMSPGVRIIRRPNVVGIRFRAYVLAANVPAGSSQALVTVEAVTEEG